MKYLIPLVSVLLLLYFAFPQKKLSFSLSERQLNDGFYLIHENSDIVKLMHREYGYVKHVKLTSPSIENLEAPPKGLQIIDLRNVDTSMYINMFKKIAFFPAAGIGGHPVQIGDFNQNGLVDFYGAYKWIQDYRLADACIVEIKSDSSFKVEKIYRDTLIRPLPSTDLNRDGIQEINFRQDDKFAHLRSIIPDSFPDSISFVYRLWRGGGGGESGVTITDLDKDGEMDLLYVGDDTLDPAGKRKIFIAEYNKDMDNFEQTYRKFVEDWYTGLFCIGDFDNDGYMEFVTGSIHSQRADQNCRFAAKPSQGCGIK